MSYLRPLEPAVLPLEPVIRPLVPAVLPLEPVIRPLVPAVLPLEPVIRPLVPAVIPLEPVGAVAVLTDISPVVPPCPGTGLAFSQYLFYRHLLSWF